MQSRVFKSVFCLFSCNKMSRRKAKETESGVKKIAEYELAGEYTGPSILNSKGKGARVSAKTTPEERNRRYFSAPLFSPFVDTIVDTLTNTGMELLLNEQSIFIAPSLARMLMQNYPELKYKGRVLKERKATTRAVSDTVYERALENIEDDLIDFIEGLFLREETNEHNVFAQLLVDFFTENYYTGSVEKSAIEREVRRFLRRQAVNLDLDDEELVLEIVGFLQQNIEQAVEPNTGFVEDLLLDILSVYQRYGKEGFPWRLHTMRELAENYMQKSDLTKILRRGIKEKYPCPNNGCGGLESFASLTERRSTDEGKIEKRVCTKCGAVRR